MRYRYYSRDLLPTPKFRIRKLFDASFSTYSLMFKFAQPKPSVKERHKHDVEIRKLNFNHIVTQDLHSHIFKVLVYNLFSLKLIKIKNNLEAIFFLSRNSNAII